MLHLHVFKESIFIGNLFLKTKNNMGNLCGQSGLLFDAFVKMVDGKQTGLYLLTNPSGSEVAVTNYGAIIVSLLVPDREGKMVDVVLGHSSIDDYQLSLSPTLGLSAAA